MSDESTDFSDPEFVLVEVVIDDEAIRNGDVWEIIDPVWWTAEFWSGADGYENSVANFSDGQRLMVSLCVYLSDTKNGGHELFLSSAFGNRWQEAMLMFDLLGVPEGRRILQSAVDRLGESKFANERIRESKIEEESIDFGGENESFVRLLSEHRVEERMTEYIRSHSADFLFSGLVRRIL